jgi:hypothetical protein
MPKSISGLNRYAQIQSFFYKSCSQNYTRLIDDFKPYFFQGFEWFGNISTQRVHDFERLTYKADELDFSGIMKVALLQDRSLKGRLRRWLIKFVSAL